MYFFLRILKYIVLVILSTMVTLVLTDVILRHGFKLENDTISTVGDYISKIILAAVCVYLFMVRAQLRDGDGPSISARESASRSIPVNSPFDTAKKSFTYLLYGYFVLICTYLFMHTSEFMQGEHDFTALLPFLRDGSIVAFGIAAFKYVQERSKTT